MVCILALVGLAIDLAIFLKKLGNFFSKSSGHPALDASSGAAALVRKMNCNWHFLNHML